MNVTPGLRISHRYLRVWQRNVQVYRKTWRVSFLPPLLEPLLYILAFGYGLSALVGDVAWRGAAVPYVAFIAPALLCIAMMYNSFFETTYGSFVRMYYQKTFDAMLATPLFLEDIIAGEIVWGATKAVIATAIMQVILTLFGLIRYPEGLLILPLSFIAGFAFASIGMVFTAVVKNIDLFNLPIFLFVTPMFLFGGTFFPLETLPAWAQVVAWGLPLTHLVELARAVGFGLLDWTLLWHLLYLAVFSALFFPLALVRMRTRLIK
jgi:lipooligosaccharide transport system permease protein